MPALRETRPPAAPGADPGGLANPPLTISRTSLSSCAHRVVTFSGFGQEYSAYGEPTVTMRKTAGNEYVQDTTDYDPRCRSARPPGFRGI